MGYKIPEVEWTGKEVNLSHLEVFGCVSYVHIDPNARDKLDAKARKCYLIGYGSDYFGYRFWDDQNRKIIRHKDVTFDEIMLYKDRHAVESDHAGKQPQKCDNVVLDDINEDDIAGRVQ